MVAKTACHRSEAEQKQEHPASEGRHQHGPKLVDTPDRPRLADFHSGRNAESCRRKVRNSPLLSPGTTTVSNTSRSVSRTTAIPATISSVGHITAARRVR